MKYAIIFLILLFTVKAVNQPVEINLLYYIQLDTILITAPTVNYEEIELCARLVSAEASNQSYKGQLAVLDVVYNRLYNNPKQYNSYKDVIFRKGQFDGVYSKYWYNPKPEHYQVAKDKLIYNKRVLSSRYEYFHNPVTSTDLAHVRRTQKNGCILIDDHEFCLK